MFSFCATNLFSFASPHPIYIFSSWCDNLDISDTFSRAPNLHLFGLIAAPELCGCHPWQPLNCHAGDLFSCEVPAGIQVVFLQHHRVHWRSRFWDLSYQARDWWLSWCGALGWTLFSLTISKASVPFVLTSLKWHLEEPFQIVLKSLSLTFPVLADFVFF